VGSYVRRLKRKILLSESSEIKVDDEVVTQWLEDT
jgi:hypothetical protein